MKAIIDLTLTLRPGMRGVEFEPKHSMPQDAWNSRMLHLYSHAGTHLDAQVHYEAGPGTVDRIPLERCLAPAWVVRLPEIAPKALIQVEHLGLVSSRIQSGEGLLLHTGWSRYWNDPLIYREQLPRISEELARWCVEKRLNLVGVEPPAVADVNNREEIRRIHQILLGGDLLIVEGLSNLEAITRPKVLFGAMPLKIEGGDGCPCRAFAIESDDLT